MLQKYKDAGTFAVSTLWLDGRYKLYKGANAEKRYRVCITINIYIMKHY
jgi:hypothetical protein